MKVVYGVVAIYCHDGSNTVVICTTRRRAEKITQQLNQYNNDKPDIMSVDFDDETSEAQYNTEYDTFIENAPLYYTDADFFDVVEIPFDVM